MESTTEPRPDTEVPAPRKSRRGRYAIGVVVTAIAVVAMLVTGTVSGNSEAATADTTTTTQPPPVTTTEPPVTDDNGNSLDTNNTVIEDLQAQILAGGPDGATDYAGVTEYIDATVAHLDTIWQNWFATNGYLPPEVAYRVVQQGEEFVTACTEADGVTHPVIAANWNNAMYCPIDVETIDGVTYTGEILLPVETLAAMWNGNVFGVDVATDDDGDFVAAVIIAHEFGHHLVDEWFTQMGLPQPVMPNSELIADCLAGNWAFSMWQDGLIEDGSIEAALAGLQALGDDNTVTGHGDPVARDNAFRAGYVGFSDGPEDDGMPSTCLTTYGGVTF